MTKLRILQYPQDRSRLAQSAQKVENFKDAGLQKIIDDMFETHYSTDNCAALAATQLDIINPPHVTVIDYSAKKDQPLCLINGEIVEREGEQNEEEGCMSVRGGTYCNVKRAYRIHVRAFDRHGNPLDFFAEGYRAKCIQHELDHLDGKLFIDHLSPLKRQRVDKKLSKLKRFGLLRDE